MFFNKYDLCLLYENKPKYLMEIKITTRQILTVLQVLTWILFIGLCVQAGGTLFSTLFVAFINPAAAAEFWEKTDLSALYTYDRGHFLALASIASVASVLKAILFYVILRLFTAGTLSMEKPFTVLLVRFMLTATCLSAGIGFFCYYGFRYSGWLTAAGVPMPDTAALHLDGADVWLLMAVILFVIAQVMKRGVEIQEENELTV